MIPVLDRAEWLYQYWLEQAGLFSDGEKLGNVAAIHRWETATMERSLERVDRRRSALADAHERVLDALDMASRAAQLLSSGSRFHNANALCEGWSLLDSSRERRLAALRAMRRYMVPLSAMRQSQEAAMASAALAAAATEATVSADREAGADEEDLTPEPQASPATPEPAPSPAPTTAPPPSPAITSSDPSDPPGGPPRTNLPFNREACATAPKGRHDRPPGATP